VSKGSAPLNEREDMEKPLDAGGSGGMIDPCPFRSRSRWPQQETNTTISTPTVIPTPEETSETTHQPIPPINLFSTKLSQTQDRP